ncbi:T9SS type A sorting domain-containing protein [Adhaeribacter aquaticus]|uniref:Ig-like domain-containing protein n=1 Tax=Adhaeribacter aquaticus TaxID=299567 RepID=UPI00040AA0BE|nr:T9SS type A sorting domain-containing protein [Adhaeribacter aquaticus]
MLFKIKNLFALIIGLLFLFILFNSQAQTINTVAGNGSSQYSGNGGLATNASLTLPVSVALDEKGNIFIADHYANVIRKVNASDGVIHTVAGTGSADAHSVGGGLATMAGLNGPTDVAVDADGNLYILDVGNYCVWKVNASDQKINKLYSYPGPFSMEGDITVDAVGNVYLAKNNRVIKINPQTGTSITVAGNGTAGFSGDGGLATHALLRSLSGVAIDAIGNIYVAGDFRIRKINASDGKINTIAGDGSEGYSGDLSLATSATIHNGTLAVDGEGNIYLTVARGNRIRKISGKDGRMFRYAGNGIAGFWGDGSHAFDAYLNVPANVAVDLNGNVYVADVYNYRIRKIFNHTGPSITQHPASEIVEVGEKAMFQVTAEGTNLTYQWQEFTGSGGYANITDGGSYAGATTAILEMKGLGANFTGNRYRVLVSENGHTTISASAKLTVNAPLPDLGVWKILGEEGFTADAVSYNSFAVSSNGIPFIAYSDKTYQHKATVMTFNGTAWDFVGKPGFSEGNVAFTALVLDSRGTPYVAFADGVYTNRISVMKYNGTDWVKVGMAGFSPGSVFDLSLTLDSNDIPYVAFGGGLNKATVMKFNGTNWVNVGNVGFSAGAAANLSLALDKNSVPYVAYNDGANANKITTMKFTGNQWENVGIAGFTADYGKLSLAISPDGAPYVAFGHLNYNATDDIGKATVMKYDGINWITVGASAFSVGKAYNCSLMISPNGTPYVAYPDEGLAGKIAVKKFNGRTWVYVGDPGFSTAKALDVYLSVSKNGTLFVSYKDGAYNSQGTVRKFSVIPPTVTNAVHCGPGIVNLTAAGGTDGNYRWYTTLAGEEPIAGATNSSLSTPTLNATTTYYVSIMSGAYESDRIAVTANINPIPAAPVVTPEVSLCLGGTASRLEATGENLQWYATATGGAPLAEAPTPNTGTAGTTEYYVSQAVNGCESSRAKIIVRVNNLPNVTLSPFPTDICTSVTNFQLTEGLPAGGVYSGNGVSNGYFNAGLAGPGNHQITYTYSLNGCTVQASQNITVNTCTGIKESSLSAATLVYPNPSTGRITVTVPFIGNNQVLVKIYDAQGRVVYEELFKGIQGTFSNTFDLSSKGKGVYLLQISTENSSIIKKLLLQ